MKGVTDIKRKLLITGVLLCGLLFTACSKTKENEQPLGDIVVDEDSVYNSSNNEELYVNTPEGDSGNISETENNTTEIVESTADPNKKDETHKKSDTSAKATKEPKKTNGDNVKTTSTSELASELDKLEGEAIYKWYKENIYDKYSLEDAAYIKTKDEYYRYIAVRYANDQKFAGYFDKNITNINFDAGCVYETNLHSSKAEEQRLKEADDNLKKQSPQEEESKKTHQESVNKATPSNGKKKTR